MKTIVNASHSRFSPLPLGGIKARGWLESQLRVEAKGMSGHLDQLEPEMIGRPYVERTVQKGVSVAWCSEISATYWAGLVQLAFTLDDPALKRKAEEWVSGVLANQEPDGYLGSYRKADNRKEDYNAFGVAWAILALTSFFEATGRTEVLEACRRGLHWFVKNWADHKTDYAGPLLIEALALVCLKTGDEALLAWAEEYMAWLERNTTKKNALHDLAGPELDYNSSHVVAYGLWMPLPAILYALDGRRDYLKASENAIRKVLRKCFQRTGGPSSNNEHLSPPGAICETEYCNFAVYAHAFAWLARITGKPHYGELVEKAVFNGAQGARRKDGRAIAYMSSPNQYFATSQSSAFGNCLDMDVYAPVYNVACCPAQSVRVLPEYVRGLCLEDSQGGFAMPWYGPCEIEAQLPSGRLGIEESTEYPFRERVLFKLTLEKTAKFPLSFRIPSWCRSASLTVNGEALELNPKPDSYAKVLREWKDGDTLELTLPMEVSVLEVNDRDFSAKRPLAIERGPLLYCLKIEPEWKEIPGTPLTPLPAGWSWFEATPASEWNYALDRNLLKTPDVIEVEERSFQVDKPWEQSPIVLHVPARKFTSQFPAFIKLNAEIYRGPDGLVEKEERIELQPYGCSNLRVSYFPGFKKNAKRKQESNSHEI